MKTQTTFFPETEILYFNTREAAMDHARSQGYDDYTVVKFYQKQDTWYETDH